MTMLIDLLHTRYPQWDFISFTEPENKPSMALLKKLGYKDMGYLPDMNLKCLVNGQRLLLSLRLHKQDTENLLISARAKKMAEIH